MLDLISVCSLVCFAFFYLLKYSEIFTFVRNFLSSKTGVVYKFLYKQTQCGFCFGFWSSILYLGFPYALAVATIVLFLDTMFQYLVANSIIKL